MMMIWTKPYSTDAMVFSDAESQSTNNWGFSYETKDMDNIVEHTTQERARALSRALLETVHLRRRAHRHPTSDLDTPPRVLEFSFEALPSPNLDEIMLDAGQVELPNIVTRSLEVRGAWDFTVQSDPPDIAEAGECTMSIRASVGPTALQR